MLPSSITVDFGQSLYFYYFSAVNSSTVFAHQTEFPHVLRYYYCGGIRCGPVYLGPIFSLSECFGVSFFIDVSTPESLKSCDRLNDAVFHRLLFRISLYHQEVGLVIPFPGAATGPADPFMELTRNLGAPFRWDRA